MIMEGADRLSRSIFSTYPQIKTPSQERSSSGGRQDPQMPVCPEPDSYLASLGLQWVIITNRPFCDRCVRSRRHEPITNIADRPFDYFIGILHRNL